MVSYHPVSTSHLRMKGNKSAYASVPACHELPQFGILAHIPRPVSNNLITKSLVKVGRLFRTLNREPPHILTPKTNPPVVRRGGAHAAHLPKLDVIHPRFYQHFAAELGGHLRGDAPPKLQKGGPYFFAHSSCGCFQPIMFT